MQNSKNTKFLPKYFKYRGYIKNQNTELKIKELMTVEHCAGPKLTHLLESREVLDSISTLIRVL